MERARRPRFWFDPRFAVGAGLIVLSVTGTTLLVAAADRTVGIVAVRNATVPGDRIDVDDIVVRRVAVDGAESIYVTPADLRAGAVATRILGAGELVPRSALGSSSGVDATTIVVPVEGELAAAVIPGAVVDVWTSAGSTDDVQTPPSVVAASVAVGRIVDGTTLVAGTGTTSVEVLVPREAVPLLLAAMADDAALSVVPATIGGTDGRS
jgi:hypothetical protein